MNPDMRQALLAVVRRIPAGRVATYGQVAALAGYPHHARLAGRALQGADDGVPWHRVLNAAGRCSLPADSAAGRQQRERLHAEGVEFRGGRVDLRRFGWQSASPEAVALITVDGYAKLSGLFDIRTHDSGLQVRDPRAATS